MLTKCLTSLKTEIYNPGILVDHEYTTILIDFDHSSLSLYDLEDRDRIYDHMTDLTQQIPFGTTDDLIGQLRHIAQRYIVRDANDKMMPMVLTSAIEWVCQSITLTNDETNRSLDGYFYYQDDFITLVVKPKLFDDDWHTVDDAYCIYRIGYEDEDEKNYGTSLINFGTKPMIYLNKKTLLQCSAEEIIGLIKSTASKYYLYDHYDLLGFVENGLDIDKFKDKIAHVAKLNHHNAFGINPGHYSADNIGHYFNIPVIDL